MRAKCLPIVLPPPYDAWLERQARDNERDPVQQARWILKQALAAGSADSSLRGDQAADAPADAGRVSS